MEQEIWKKIPNFEKYEISSMGRCRKITSHNTYKYLKGGVNERKYPTVHLYGDVGDRIMLKSQLVAESFLPNPNNGWQVRHKNGDVGDNRVDNLCWQTHKNRKF